MRDRLLYRDRDVTRERDCDWRSARAPANHRRGEIQTVYGARSARPPRLAPPRLVVVTLHSCRAGGQPAADLRPYFV